MEGRSRGTGVLAMATVVAAATACATRPPPSPAPAPPPAVTATPPPAPRAPDVSALVDGAIERIAAPADGPVRGPRTAKVTIVEIGEFECPFCARVEPTLQRLVREHPDDLCIVFRHNPMPFHPHAQLAAEAAVAAGTQGKFWEMHDRLFNDQKALDRASLDAHARALGLNEDAFGAELDARTGQAVVDGDAALARRLGAKGTPTFFINGRPVEGAQGYDVFARIVDDEIARADRLLAAGVAPADLYATFVAHGKPSLPPRVATAGTEVYAVPIDDAPARGGAQPKVTIVEFAGFQCPFSARAAATLAKVLGQYGDDVALVYRHSILPQHPQARPAALAAEAAREQGKFWEMHDKLFAGQVDLAPAALERYAGELGLDVKAFRRSVDDGHAAARIGRDRALATRFGAVGTPFFFVNGRVLRGAQPIEVWQKLVDEEIKKANARLAAGTPRAQLYAALTGGGLDRVAPDPQKPARPDPDQRFRIDVAGAPSRGPADAIVTIVEWADLECPYCRTVEDTLARLLRAYPGQVRVVWRDFPLTNLHPHAMDAALAARAAREQGRFWEMHEAIFADQEHLDSAAFERHARELRLNMKRFRAAIGARRGQQQIDDDVAAATKVGARGTPTFFINGRFLSGAQPLEVFETRVKEELQAAEPLLAAGTPRARIYDALMKDAEPAFAPR